MRTIKDLELKNKRVLVRADFNVPVGSDGQITDDNRIKEFIPTLKYILEQGGIPILMTHLGSPSGKPEAGLSLKPVAEKLASLAGVPVRLAPDCIGNETLALTTSLASGSVLLLENLRFHEGEQSNDAAFSLALAKNGDVYIDDAFATAHRKHASMVGVAQRFDEKGIGLLMQRELNYFERALVKPKRPLCVVLGGAKVSSKLNALINIADKCDKLIIGGAMANTFLAAQGLQVGRSLVEHELIGKALELLGSLARRECKVYLPVDLMVGPAINSVGLARAVPALEIPADMMALDIGPASAVLFRQVVHSAETILWNGPMGAFENEDYSKGTQSMIEAVASAHGLSVVGGGDTDAAIHKMELAHKFGYISTGGGAFLALLEGKKLPALAALE